MPTLHCVPRANADIPSIAYTDHSYSGPPVDYFPLLEDPSAVEAGMGQALDPSWYAAELPGGLGLVIPPFSNVDYLE